MGEEREGRGGVVNALEQLLGDLPASDGLAGLPFDHLSASSIDKLWKCPEQFRRERVLKEPTSTSGRMLFGSAFGKAAEHNYLAKMESREDLPVATMRDVAGDSFNAVVEEEKGKREIVWHDAAPNKVQQGVICAMVGTDSNPAGYLQVFAPTVQPVAVERTFNVVTRSGVKVTGRIDVESERGQVIDLKTTTKAKTQTDLDKDNQATTYLWAREQEGNPATEFAWHVVKQNLTTPGLQEVVGSRTPEQIRLFDSFVDMTVATIRRYMEDYGPDSPWPPAPPMAWWCSPTSCGLWSTCKWRGGA